MNRRALIKSLGLGSMALAGGLITPSTWAMGVGKKGESAKNFAWATPEIGKNRDYFKAQLENAKACGIDGIILEVYNGRKAYFETDRLPMEEDLLSLYIPLCKSIGLELHTWMWTMPCNIEEIYKKHPDWYAVNGKGEPSWQNPAYVDYYKFLCPCNEEAMDFVAGTAASLADIGEIDGVHFDYVRLPDVIIAEGLQPKYNIVQDREYPEYDYSYSVFCREKFKAQTGIDPLKDLEDPAANEEWRQFRYDSITNLVNDKLIPTVKKQGKIASAAVFPNWQHVRQEWRKWHLDFAAPMLYHNFYNQDISWIGERLNEEIQEQEVPKTIYSGIFVPSLDPQSLKKAYQISIDSGAAGVSLFNLKSMDNEKWEVLKRLVKT